MARARGREAQARGPGRDRRRLPRRGAPGRQARPGRRGQDAGRGRGRDHGRQEAEAAAAERGQGLPQEGGREGSPSATSPPGSTVVSDGLSCWPAVEKAGCSHRPMATGSGKRAASWTPFKWVNTALGNIKTAIAGTYHHVSAEARPVLPDQLRLPLQPPLPARQHRRAPRLGRRPHRPAALPGRHRGCVSRTIRYKYDRSDGAGLDGTLRAMFECWLPGFAHDKPGQHWPCCRRLSVLTHGRRDPMATEHLQNPAKTNNMVDSTNVEGWKRAFQRNLFYVLGRFPASATANDKVPRARMQRARPPSRPLGQHVRDVLPEASTHGLLFVSRVLVRPASRQQSLSTSEPSTRRGRLWR